MINKAEKEIFLIPYSHLDTQWRWEFPTTINIYLKNTIDESIELFEKYEEHRFNFTGAIRYSMMKEYFPEKFERVRKYIDQQRWFLAGTCLDETDALVPAVESMVRNVLYGDRWAKSEFGRSSRDYMIPDCFGFPANMPSVMAHCGLNGFSSNKLTWESSVGIPFEIGVWKGPDGSEIVSALNPCRYDSHMELPIYLNPGRLGRLKKLGKKNNIWKSFQYYGVGDIGGAPTEGSVRRVLSSIRHYAKKDGALTVRQGSADEFFNEITADERERMDRYEGDFLLKNHSAGTITSAAIMKRWNRKNEQLAFAAEAAAVSAWQYGGAAYPADKIKSAWTRIIANQMHDILPGTSTPTAYEYSHNDEVIALKTWSTVLEDSAEAIAPLIKGDGDIILFNPYPGERCEPVDLELTLTGDHSDGMVSVRNAQGEKLPAVLKNIEKDRVRLMFIPDQTPLAWSRFSLMPSENPPVEIDDAVSLSETERGYVLENNLYSVRISLTGRIESVYRKDIGKEIFEKPIAYEFQKERPMKFPAWNMDWRDRKKKPYKRIEEGGQVRILEKNALRSTIEITTTFGNSTLVKEVSLSRGSEIVDFIERIHWRETGCSMKLAFTGVTESPEFTCNWETSRIKRDVNHKKTFEMPSRLWADLSENDQGFSIIEDSKYGWDRPERNTIRMTLLFTPGVRYLNGFLDQKSHDWGEHTIKYGIRGHNGDWRETDSFARRFNQPVRPFLLKNSFDGAGKTDLSLLNVSTDQIGILAVKKAEDEDGIIVRIYERHGESAEGFLSFPSSIKVAAEVNGLEEIIGESIFTDDQLSISLGANGIKSFMVKLKDRCEDKQIMQLPVSLEYNSRLIGKNTEDSKAVFPAELTPKTIQAGRVQFLLASELENNAVCCEGQKLEILPGYATLSLLIGSIRSCEVDFHWMDSEGLVTGNETAAVSSLTDFVGQWDTRLWKREPNHHLKHRRDYAWLNKCVGVRDGYVNRNRLEWYSTHTHENGKDLAYRYGYLYKLTFTVPAGVNVLKLPENSNIHIFAATVSEQAVTAKSIGSLTDKYDF